MLGQSREEQNQRDLAALRAEIDQLTRDLRALTGTLRGLGARNLAPAGERLREAADRARQKVRASLAAPPANPQRLAGAAFAVGFVIGVLLRGRPRPAQSEE